MVKTSVIALAAAASALLASACGGGNAGVRDIEITQADGGCTPKSVDVVPSETLRLVVKNESSTEYEIEGIDGTDLEEVVVPKGTRLSIEYSVPPGAQRHKLKCYVPAGPATIIELVAGGALPFEETSAGGDSSRVAEPDPDPEATSLAEVAFDLADFRQAAGDQTFTLTNQSGFAVDLGGWSVVYGGWAAKRRGLPAGVVLAPAQSVTVHMGAGDNGPADVYLDLPPDVAERAYTPGDLATGIIDVESNEGQGYFRYIVPTPELGR